MNPCFALFRTAEWLAGGAPGPQRPPAADNPTPALTVYASTLGELNAIAPFLERLCQSAPQRPLCVISEHAHYFPAVRRRWPQATCHAIDHHSRTAREFFRVRPTAFFVLAEIPLLPADAPARLPFAWLHYARKARARCALINGWLYREPTACRIDRLERALLWRAQLRHFDLITVQDETLRDTLLELGVPPARVHAPGNLKFDATAPRVGLLPQWGQRAVVVAGSMNNVAEYQQVLDAFGRLRARLPQAALVLAPRHPENLARTDQLCAMLAQRGWHHVLRSTLPALRIPDEVDCLVLDTLGELAGCYARAGCAHVGINHNVLEPLHFARHVTVSPGWEPRYPGARVCRQMQQAGLVREASDAETLAACWHHALEHPGQDTAALKAWQGASARTLSLWQSVMEP